MSAMPYERPSWVRRINAMAGGFDGPARMVGLDPDELVATATQATGLSDLGPPEWEEPFRRLVRALEDEADLHVLGRLLTRHDLLRHLATRLRLEDARRRDPGIADEQIVGPVVITGPARSGTTILHELLAEDDALRAPLAFEMAHPVAPAGGADERRAWAESEFDIAGDVQPEFRAIHELSAGLPEECLWLLAPEFDTGYWSTCVDVPSFAAWRARSDATALYARHRAFLQVLQRGAPPRRWVLKSPLHLGRLPALFAVYPDARVIMTHRDPVRTVPSTASAVAVGRWLRSDGVDPHRVAASVAFGLGMIMNGVAAARSSLPDGQVAHVQYLDLVREPVATIERAYGDIGLAFADEHARRVTEHLEDRPATKHGVHRYGPEDFGLDADQVRAELEPYTSAFDVLREDGS